MSLNPLEDLWSSTEELPKRFSLDVSTDAQMRKFFEEVYEFSREVLHRTLVLSVDDIDNERIARELTDVIVVGMVLCQKLGIQFEQLQDAFEFVIDKNDAKTLYTHEIINGKITRK